MTSKREWRKRYKAEHRGASEMETALIEANGKLADAEDRVATWRQWAHSAEREARSLLVERNRALAQRDLARDVAAALEGEIARIKAAVEGLASLQFGEWWGVLVTRAAVLACFDAVEEEPELIPNEPPERTNQPAWVDTCCRHPNGFACSEGCECQ